MLKNKRLLLLPILLILIAFVIIGTKAGYPYQRTWAFGVLTLGWIPIAISYYINRKLIRVSQKIVVKKTRPFLPHAIVAIILIAAIYIANVLTPKHNSQLTEMTSSELRSNIDGDYFNYKELCQAIDHNIDMFKTSGLLSKDINQMSIAEKKQLKQLWFNGILLSFECDVMKEKYSGFYLIDYNDKPELHSDAFFLAYATYIAQYDACLKLHQIINNNSFMETFLNEDTEQISENTCLAMKQMLFNPTVALRTNAGSVYYKLVEKNISFDKETLKDFEKREKEFYKTSFSNPQNYIDNPLDILEETAVNTCWFPIQKNVALQLSYIRTTKRDYQITPELIQQNKSVLEPGDILFERRNWHMTNIGIPGFWPHTALYIGTTDELIDYFGPNKLTALKTKYPEIYSKLSSKDPNNYPYAVIEAIRPGVILQSLEKSANCDYLAVVRPKITKEQKWNAIMNALSHYKKPYDMNFDFNTDTELVCSELIYKSYMPVKHDMFKTSIINGRPLLPPNEMAKQVIDNPQFETILFIDSSEQEQKAFSSETENFSSTPQRAKWDIMQE
ncbi:MAG: YiiX/YebB-like N1pC/P60 family cysteine hydrolase [Kiritimatiellae bacterium]|jgi:hypothetical protein|nr:YiiX/YebB-like N1pC/P60 family cysteine hydrolase [Kiritimatiellia bacterium]